MGSCCANPNKRRTTVQLKRFSISDLKKVGIFDHQKPVIMTISTGQQEQQNYAIGYQDESVFIVEYDNLFDDCETANGQFITIGTSPCHYGGYRRWLICPTCQKRVGVLYDNHGFQCRQCCDLVYPCQRDDQYSHLVRSQMRLLEKVGYPVDWQSRCLPKPKGMHEKTYLPLAEKYRAVTEQLEKLMLKRVFG